MSVLITGKGTIKDRPPRRWLLLLLEAASLASGIGSTWVASVITIEEHIKYATQNGLVPLPGLVGMLLSMATVVWALRTKRKIGRIGWAILVAAFVLGFFGVIVLTQSEPYNPSGGV